MANSETTFLWFVACNNAYLDCRHKFLIWCLWYVVHTRFPKEAGFDEIMKIHCVKYRYRNFILFPGAEILWKSTVST